MKKLIIMGGLSVALLSTSMALAQGNQGEHHTGIYLGANYGGFKARGGDFNDDRHLIEGVAGWQISPHLAVEGNYIDFSEYGSRGAIADVDGYGAAVVGKLPISDSFAIYAKGGRFWWDGSVRLMNVRANQNDESWFYGVGALFQISELVGVTAEYKRYDIEYDHSKYPVSTKNSDIDLDTVTVGVRFSL